MAFLKGMRPVWYESWDDAKPYKRVVEFNYVAPALYRVGASNFAVVTLSQMNACAIRVYPELPTRRYFVGKTPIVVRTLCELKRPIRLWSKKDGGPY